MFKYPVGVQLFNRPNYARSVLSSLSQQTLAVNPEKIVIFIDGFKGSIYETRGSVDFTEEVESIARHFFPLASIKNFRSNCGVAQLHFKIQEETFKKTQKWGTFFEEDIVLDSTYLQELSDLITITNEFTEIVKVSCFQLAGMHHQLQRGSSGFYNGVGTKAFAERKSFYKSKKPMLQEFIDLEMRMDLPKHTVAKGSSSVKDVARLAELAKPGALGTVIRTFQKDVATDMFLHQQAKLHVVTKPYLATDIGIEGVHGYVSKTVSSNYMPSKGIENTQQRRDELHGTLPTLFDESREY